MDLFYKDIVSYTADSEVPIPGLTGLVSKVSTAVKAQRTLMKIPFYIDETMSIGVKFYSGPMEKKKPGHVYTTRQKNERVETKTMHYCADTESQLRGAEMKRGTNYGAGAKVIFDQKEQKEMKTFGNPGLFLQGFKPKARLKMQYNVKNAKFIRPDESVITGSKQLFAAMLQKCLDKDVVAICRLVARYNSAPTFVALLPQPEVEATADNPRGNPAGFHVITLPFADDMRKLPYADRPEVAVADKQAHVEAADAVVSKLQSAAYIPGKYENVALSKFHKYIEAIVFDRDDVEAVDTMKPDLEAMTTAAGAEMAAFTALVYPEGYEGGQAAPKKRKADGAAGGGAKRIKKEPAAPVDLGSLDFKKMVTDGTLKKQTVKVLKQFLVSVGRAGTGKKAELLEAVEAHFGL